MSLRRRLWLQFCAVAGWEIGRALVAYARPQTAGERTMRDLVNAIERVERVLEEKCR